MFFRFSGSKSSNSMLFSNNLETFIIHRLRRNHPLEMVCKKGKMLPYALSESVLFEFFNGHFTGTEHTQNKCVIFPHRVFREPFEYYFYSHKLKQIELPNDYLFTIDN